MHLARMEGKMQGHLRLAKPLPKPGTVINPEPLLGASASQNDLAAHDHMMHVDVMGSHEYLGHTIM